VCGGAGDVNSKPSPGLSSVILSRQHLPLGGGQEPISCPVGLLGTGHHLGHDLDSVDSHLAAV
jgi:hypothetical protein